MKHLLIAFAAAGFLIACSPQTTEVIEVVEVEEEVTTTENGDMPKADIGEGKVLFLKDCIGCHGDYAPGPRSAEEVNKFTKAQYEAALPRMIENAEYNQTQARQVTAYIYWELEN